MKMNVAVGLTFSVSQEQFWRLTCSFLIVFVVNLGGTSRMIATTRLTAKTRLWKMRDGNGCLSTDSEVFG